MNPRIIAGTAKNKKLLVPETSRPVTDRIKQSVFDLIGDRVVGAQVLDLYAGSGSFGIECLSRGATQATFVEQSDAAVELLRQNLQTTKFTDKATIFQQSTDAFLINQAGTYDLIFCDPPFIQAADFQLDQLAALLVNKSSLIIFRTPTKSSLPPITQLMVAYSQVYGESEVYFLGKK